MNDRQLKLKSEYKLRSSQAISPFGVGAIVDFKRQSLMAASTKFWNVGNCYEIHDERLERVLNVDTFFIPQNIDEDKDYGFPFVNFPEWYFCPSCRVFKPLMEWEEDYLNSPRGKDKNAMLEPKCSKCKNTDLVPARIVCICEQGHISDFPWIAWVHYKSGKNLCKEPKLKISTLGSSTGLEGIKIKCDTCNASATLKGSFKKDGFMDIVNDLNNSEKFDMANMFLCSGNMPWSLSKETCTSEKGLVVVQRGATNLHYSKIISSIVIPPYSNKLSKDIESNSTYREIIKELEEFELDESEEDMTREEFLNQKYITRKIRRISEEIRFDIEETSKLIHRKILKDDVLNYNEMDYRTDEYKAIMGKVEIEDLAESDFKIENTDISKYQTEFLSKVVLVKKMREVRALVGFTRLLPPDNKHFNENNTLQESKLISTRRGNWYPAYEVRGEGIFLEFDHDKLKEWSIKEAVINRAKKINDKNLEQSKRRGLEARIITPEFIVLHTFAHLLIKQLSFDCGYSSASLRERIYYNSNSENQNMCGILIYTASGDSEGTLGGLIRQGHHDRLPKLIQKALANAAWCSNDPVCIESKGQGRDSLNLGACYSCSLISETSCEEFNTLLDRGLLIGTIDDRDLGYLSGYLD